MNNIVDLEEKYPEVMDVIKEIIGECTSQTESHPLFFWKEKVVIKTKEEVFYEKYVSLVEDITQPIYSLCNDILVGEVTISKGSGMDSREVEVGGITFSIRFDGFCGKIVLSSIFNNRTEERLFLRSVTARECADEEKRRLLARSDVEEYYRNKT